MGGCGAFAASTGAPLDPVACAVELVKCWGVGLAGPFLESSTDRGIEKRGDRRFTDDAIPSRR